MTTTRAMAIASLPIVAVVLLSMVGCFQLLKALWSWRGVRS